MPIGDVENGRQGVTADAGHVEGIAEDPCVQGDSQQEEEEPREEPPGAPGPEMTEADGPPSQILAAEQAGDEETGQHKEHINPEQSAVDPVDPSVVQQHGHDGKGTDAVQRRETTTPSPSGWPTPVAGVGQVRGPDAGALPRLDR